MKKQQALRELEHYEQLCWFTFGFLALVLCSNAAYATSTPMEDVLCTIIGWMLGNIGAGLATIAVSSIGVGALIGKVSWGLAFTVVVGVVVMFGATTVASDVLGVGDPCS